MIASREQGGLGMGLGEAMDMMGTWLGLEERVKVMPITEDPCHYRLHDGGHIYASEDVVDVQEIKNPLEAVGKITSIYEGGEVKVYAPAARRISQSRLFGSAQGSMRTTHDGIFAVAGVAEAVQQAEYFVVVANPTEDRDTRGIGIDGFVRVIGGVAGRMPNYIVVDTSNNLPEGRKPLHFDEERVSRLGARIVKAEIIVPADAPEAGDRIAHLRSDVRTSGELLAAALARELLVPTR
jgi:hypothetical protein